MKQDLESPFIRLLQYSISNYAGSKGFIHIHQRELLVLALVRTHPLPTYSSRFASPKKVRFNGTHIQVYQTEDYLCFTVFWSDSLCTCMCLIILSFINTTWYQHFVLVYCCYSQHADLLIFIQLLCLVLQYEGAGIWMALHTMNSCHSCENFLAHKDPPHFIPLQVSSRTRCGIERIFYTTEHQRNLCFHILWTWPH